MVAAPDDGAQAAGGGGLGESPGRTESEAAMADRKRPIVRTDSGAGDARQRGAHARGGGWIVL